jgi:hypothetical protein
LCGFPDSLCDAILIEIYYAAVSFLDFLYWGHDNRELESKEYRPRSLKDLKSVKPLEKLEANFFGWAVFERE